MTVGTWRFGCWTEDGYLTEHGPECAYHRQWVCVAGDNSMVGWIEPAGCRFRAFAWNDEIGDHVEVTTMAGTPWTYPAAARRAVDEVLSGVRLVGFFEPEGTP
ncbi:MAG TPA: hypothetical protein VM013_01160 [Dehalococcoidia bacterium]|nr:hypothetical protein [Dehalococcoidia bacterium]